MNRPSRFFRSSTFLLLSALFAVPVASARLGETLEKCEERYGELRERISPEFPLSDQYATVFIKEGIRIVIEYKDGLAWKLTYEGDSGMVANYAVLLSYNNDEKPWGEAFELLKKKYWIRPDGKAHAVAHSSSNRKKYYLTLIDDQFLKARAAGYKDRLTRGEEIRAEYLNKANPLPGF